MQIARTLAAVALAAALISPVTAHAQPADTSTCYEDMPCWDCATMGNRVCGPDIAVDADGQLRDCTVTDNAGNRADFAAVCDLYWSAR